MRTVLFAPLNHPRSHIAECLAIAACLADAGHRCIFLCTPDKQAFIESAGIPTRLVPEPWQAGAMGKPSDWLQDVALVEHCLVAELDAIQDIAPDLVVASHRHTTGAVCRRLELPMVSLLHPCLHPDFNGFPGVADSLQDQHARDAVARTHAALTATLQPAFEAVGTCVEDYRALLLGEANYYPCIDALWTEDRTAQASQPVFAGPLHWAGWQSLPAVQWSDQGLPRVLLFFGSEVGPGQTFDWLALLDAMPIDAVLVSDRKPDRPWRNVRHMPRADLHAAVATADLAVTHAGINILQLCLEHGTPCLTLPNQLEQAENALHASKLGIARYPDLAWLTERLDGLDTTRTSQRLSLLLHYMQRLETGQREAEGIASSIRLALTDIAWQTHCEALRARHAPALQTGDAARRIAQDCERLI